MILKRMKQLRLDRGLSQREVSGYLNIARNTYANYELGCRAVPVEILSDLADYYETSIDYIVGRTDIKGPS